MTGGDSKEWPQMLGFVLSTTEIKFFKVFVGQKSILRGLLVQSILDLSVRTRDDRMHASVMIRWNRRVYNF